VFFRETGLGANEEPVGAQGVSLTPWRSIAVDRNLHVYGTPFFVSGELPIESEQPMTKFRNLMIAQDTGGAIIGPARADIYFGAGEPAASIAGRMRHPGRFVMLVPISIDPYIAKVPLPRPKPAIDEVAAKPDTDKPTGKPSKQKKEAALETEKPAKPRKSKRQP
jgi:membrane-bound lytic murein transglycosylase A